MRFLPLSESSDQLVYPHVKLARRWHPALPHTDAIYLARSELCFTSAWVSAVCKVQLHFTRPLCKQPHVQLTTIRSPFQSNMRWRAGNRWKCQGRLCFFFFPLVICQMMPSCFLSFTDSQLSPYCKLLYKIQKQVSLGTGWNGRKQFVFHPASLQWDTKTLHLLYWWKWIKLLNKYPEYWIFSGTEKYLFIYFVKLFNWWQIII